MKYISVECGKASLKRREDGRISLRVQGDVFILECEAISILTDLSTVTNSLLAILKAEQKEVWEE